VVVVGFAGWALVRLAGWDSTFPVLQLIAFTPFVAGVAVLIPDALLLLRRTPAALAALAVAVVLVAVLVPRATPDGGPLPTGPTLRVLSSNMLEGGADPDTIVALVRAHAVDLVAIQEYTPGAQHALDLAGLRDLLPYTSMHPAEGVGGSALYSRYPLRDDGVRNNPGVFTQARGTLSVPGAPPVAVESVHTCAPSGAPLTRCWADSFPNQPPATVDGPVRLLLGDFNATLDHSVLRRLLATGYRDAADVLGDGMGTTWPYDKLFPRITLDHVLADRRVGVRAFAIHPVPRSDHRALYAELVLPGA
jgi:endonuclease/exonuclease/phosphatase (EEP) superfamily protein YafD